MPMSPYAAKKTGDAWLNKGSFPTETDLYLALFSANPVTNPSAELTFTGYARQDVTSAFGAFSLATGIATSTADVSFGSPGSDDLPAAYAAFFDASSSGNLIYYEAIPNPRAVVSGMRPLKFRAGELTIQHS